MTDRIRPAYVAAGAVIGLPVAAVGTILAQATGVRSQERPKLPAVFSVADAAGSAAAGDAALSVVWLGDSTAAGVGASSRENSLPGRVAAYMANDVSLDVLAVPGARVADVVEKQVPLTADRAVDVVMISVGANDVTGMTSLRRFRRSYRQLLAALPEGVEVVTLGVPDLGSSPILPQPLRGFVGTRALMFDRIVSSEASRAGAWYASFPRRTGLPAIDHVAEDGYHPGDKGYGVWAAAVVASLAPHSPAWLDLSV